MSDKSTYCYSHNWLRTFETLSNTVSRFFSVRLGLPDTQDLSRTPIPYWYSFDSLGIMSKLTYGVPCCSETYMFTYLSNDEIYEVASISFFQSQTCVSSSLYLPICMFKVYICYALAQACLGCYGHNSSS